MSRCVIATSVDLKKRWSALQSSKLLTYIAAKSRERVPMQAIVDYVGCIAENFKAKLGPALIEVYKIGSLAHGGFSQVYSDIDVGLILSCPNPAE